MREQPAGVVNHEMATSMEAFTSGVEAERQNAAWGGVSKLEFPGTTPGNM